MNDTVRPTDRPHRRQTFPSTLTVFQLHYRATMVTLYITHDIVLIMDDEHRSSHVLIFIQLQILHVPS